MRIHTRLLLLAEFAIICLLLSLLAQHSPVWDRYASVLFGFSLGIFMGVGYAHYHMQD